MSKRTAAPVFAVLLSSLASAALMTSAIAAPATDDSAENSANECLAAPKGAAPQGSHWYYHIEKGTKRKCWYLADQAAKARKVATVSPTPTTPSAKPAAPRAPEAAIQPTVANARAELTSRSPKVENAPDDAALSETIWPAPEPRTDAANSSDQSPNVQPENAGAVAATPPAKDWDMTSRWPDSNLPNATSDSSVAPAETRPQQTASLQTVSAKAKPAAPVAAEQSHGIALNGTPMLLIMLAGVLTIVAVAARMITKYASSGRAKNRNQRRNIWDSAPQESDASQAYESLLQPRSTQFAPVSTEANDPGNEIEKLLQRVSKRVAA